MEKVFMMSGGDFIGMIVAAFLIYLVKRNNFIGQIESRKFEFVVHMTAIIMILEIITNILKQYASPQRRILLFIVNFLGFSLMFFLPVLLGMIYSEKVYKRKIIFLIPAMIGSILSFCSFYTRWIFWIDYAGNYERGTLFYMAIVIQFFGFCVLYYAHIEMAQQYDRWERNYLWILFGIICGTNLIQVLNADIVIMWGGIAIAELFYYIFLRELQFRYDPVTKVKNRIVYVEQLEKIIPDEHLFYVSFDMNNLKYINDHFGHLEGDKILFKTGQLIKKAYSDCGEVFRVGGDEFVVIAQNCELSDVLQAKKKMLKMIRAERNDFGGIGYYIANGFCQFDVRRHKSIDDCRKESDERMYEDKMRSKKQSYKMDCVE